MKKSFNLKKYVTATNVLILVLILFYLLDRYLPFPEGYTGYNAWFEDESPVFNYIFGSCGGLLSNYMARGEFLENGYAIYRNFTCTFLHGHILHIIANLLGLYFIGNYTEKRFGWWLTLILFVSIAFIESFITDPLYIAMFPEKSEEIANTISMGASSGIFGLAGVSLAALLFNIKSFKSVGLPTIIVSVIYGVFTTYIASFGWTTLCHNVAIILGLFIGTLIILPFYILKKKKISSGKVDQNEI